MKSLAILFMILIFLLMIGFGFFYLLGFAMSFDAPGSDKDPSAWMMRLLMFLPGLILLGALILAFMSFSSGHYKRSVIISSVPLAMSVLFILYLYISSFTAMADYNKQRMAEAADARKYPVQNFLRHTDIGADTVIVFPNRIVAYRLQRYNGYPYNGPLGDLNEDRTAIIYNNRPDTKLSIEELDQFVDQEGRRLTDVYRVSEGNE
jgi:hypothetical protein